jgi:hypothetical protein
MEGPYASGGVEALCMTWFVVNRTYHMPLMW